MFGYPEIRQKFGWESKIIFWKWEKESNLITVSNLPEKEKNGKVNKWLKFNDHKTMRKKKKKIMLIKNIKENKKNLDAFKW